MTSPDPVPDAVGAVIAAVLADHPGAEPGRLGRLVMEQLRWDGWWVCPPEGRGTTDAVPTVRAVRATERRAAVRHQGRAVRPSTENELSEMRHV